MTAHAIRIADAVAAEINTAVVVGTAFEVNDFTAMRRYADWDEEFSDIPTESSQPFVDVVYRSDAALGLQSRGYLLYEIPVHVAVRRRFARVDRGADGRLKNTSLDPMVTLLEDLFTLFVERRNETAPLQTETEVKWIGEKSTVRWLNQTKLRMAGLFEGYVELHFQLKEAA